MSIIVRKLKDDEFTVLNHNGTARTTIPDDWAEWTNLKPGTDCTIALVLTKHGLAYMVWSDEQPQLEDIGEEL